MVELRTEHTADLEPATLAEIRSVLDGVFAGDFQDTDWDHAMGGMHAVLREDGEVIAHGAVVARRLLNAGRPWRTGYVEAVGVRPDRRRRGHAGTIMAELERIIVAAYDLGALGASTAGAPFYTGRGWRAWPGPTAVLGPAGVVRTPTEDGAVHVLADGVALDWSEELICDWRDADVW